MKIISSAVNLSAERAFYQEDTVTSSLTFRQDDENRNSASPSSSGPATDQLSLSREAKNRAWPCAPDTGTKTEAAAPAADDMAEDPRLRVLRLTLELLTGRRIPVAVFHPAGPDGSAMQLHGPDGAPAAAGQPDAERAGWGMEYDYYQSHAEQESINFSAAGLVVTAEGQKIALSFDLLMQRQSFMESHVHLQAGDARLVDPLVINFSGQGTRVGDVRVSFDLDLDGRQEEFTFVAPDSGFLALDRNNDGQINDGAELFGPVSGHGFAELADLDADSNGWLDENDPIFAKLKVWMADQAGKQRLASLAEMQIGALLLTPLDTQFTLADSNGSPLGRIRQTSLALLEHGAAASVQEIDLVV